MQDGDVLIVCFAYAMVIAAITSSIDSIGDRNTKKLSVGPSLSTADERSFLNLTGFTLYAFHELEKTRFPRMSSQSSEESVVDPELLQGGNQLGLQWF